MLTLAHLKQHLYSPGCLHCGSFFVQEHLFCKECFSEKVITEFNLQDHIIQENLRHYFLIKWVPGQSDLLSRLIYQLKNNKSPIAWQYYAQQFILALAGEFPSDFFDAIVPLPGSTPSSSHSVLFAEALANYLRCPVLNCLQKSTGQLAQKTQTAKQRRELADTILLREKDEFFTQQMFKSMRILYVDDILTTGATFIQSYRALQSRSDSCIFTLFHRTRNN